LNNDKWNNENNNDNNNNNINNNEKIWIKKYDNEIKWK